MKEITQITIDRSAIGPSSQTKSYVVSGDPGAVFSMTITNEDNHYYNFSTKKLNVFLPMSCLQE